MVFSPPLRASFVAPIASLGVVTPWWLLGGVTAAQCAVAYQPKGAASLAASYINRNNPGTNNAAPGTAPTFATGTGWTFNGTTQYLTTGIVPASGYSLIVQFSGVDSSVSVGWLAGAYNSSGNNRLSVGNPNGTGFIEYGSGKTINVNHSPAITSGSLAVAGQQGYYNGIADGGAIAAWNGTVTAGINIADLGGFGTAKLACTIIALAIYNITLSATQVGLIAAAMAAL